MRAASPPEPSDVQTRLSQLGPVPGPGDRSAPGLESIRVQGQQDSERPGGPCPWGPLSKACPRSGLQGAELALGGDVPIPRTAPGTPGPSPHSGVSKRNLPASPQPMPRALRRGSSPAVRPSPFAIRPRWQAAWRGPCPSVQSLRLSHRTRQTLGASLSSLPIQRGSRSHRSPPSSLLSPLRRQEPRTHPKASPPIALPKALGTRAELGLPVL